MFEVLREKPNVSPQLVNGSMHSMEILNFPRQGSPAVFMIQVLVSVRN